MVVEKPFGADLDDAMALNALIARSFDERDVFRIDHFLAKQTVLEWFPNIALPGDLSQELPQPAQFEDASELLSEDDMAEIVACGRPSADFSSYSRKPAR